MSIDPFFVPFHHFAFLIFVAVRMTTIPPLFCHAQRTFQDNVHPCSCVIRTMHIKKMLFLFFIRFSLRFHVHPCFFNHFSHFRISILVTGHMTTIPALFCHAQPLLQNNVHPCSCVIPSMHIKRLLVLFFIHFSLLFHVHQSFFYQFPTFPYFNFGCCLHDNYPSPLCLCTTSISKQCSSMFMCYSIDFDFCTLMFCFLQPCENTTKTRFRKGQKITGEQMGNWGSPQCARFPGRIGAR